MRTRIEAVRRQDLIQAAYQTLLEHGYGGMTVARISRTAGMSPGIVNYYFDGKDQLLISVVRYALKAILGTVVERLREATTPRERISAVIAGNFNPDAFNRRMAQAWVSFYAAIPANPEIARLQELVYRRLRSNLMDSLRHLTGEENAEAIARGVAVMIDGLWVECSMDSQALSSEEAIALIEDYVDRRLAARH